MNALILVDLQNDFCRAAPWRCRMVMRSSRLQMNCSDASTSSSRPKIGIRPTTAASPQTTRERSRGIASFSTESNKSYGQCIAFRTRTVPSSPPYSTRAASLMFFTRAPSETLIVTVRFSTTPTGGTLDWFIIWRSDRSRDLPYGSGVGLLRQIQCARRPPTRVNYIRHLGRMPRYRARAW